MTVPGDLTEDALLDGRVRLRQPARGYRVAIDPLLLAAAVPVRAGETVLDLGTGVGAAALCCATRVPGCRVVGLEIQEELADLARGNAALNGIADAVRIVAGDIAAPPASIARDAFDHVMANPPFGTPGTGSPSPDRSKQVANVEGESRVADWVSAAVRAVKPGGTITFIHRADRLRDLLAALDAAAGGEVVFPLWPKRSEDCRRLLVHAKRGSKAPLRLAAGLVLHEPDGAYSAAAQAILRGGGPLTL